ncbi:hypothetical protein [Paenibacillus silvisoli]|uniref:hypothetical protein n=1 Tax=Paenibacillus silvisoli TaxID=3110539 RepID=UPI002803EF25|nr:hypothetical protein [Paenibacillus silvisoli]
MHASNQTSTPPTGWKALSFGTLGTIGAVAGPLLLLVTWLLFRNKWESLAWYGWITPALLTLAGVLCLLAAILLLARRTAGRDVLELALALIPITLALRLVTVIVIFIGTAARKLFDGSIGSFFSDLDFTSTKFIVNVAVVVVIIALVSIRRTAKNKAKGE